MSEELREVMLW